SASQPLLGEALFPRGILREPLGALRRAHAVLLTHADRASPAQLEELRAALTRLNPAAALAEARHGPGRLTRLGSREVAEAADLRTGRWLAVSSLGDPAAFTATLAGLGLDAAPI